MVAAKFAKLESRIISRRCNLTRALVQKALVEEEMYVVSTTHQQSRWLELSRVQDKT